MQRGISRSAGLLTVAFFCSLISGVRSGTASGTPDRAHWVEITHKLENNPLDEDLDRQGAAVIKEIEDDHAIRVALCPPLLFDFNGMKYVYSRVITRQFMLASTAFMVEHPDAADNSNRENRRLKDVAALKSVLKAYTSILSTKPEARQKLLDDLLRQETEGKLPDYIKKKCP